MDLYDYGLEVGGPLIEDRLWVWGAWDVQDINEIQVGGLRNDTDIESQAAKVDAQLSPTASLTAKWSHADKVVGGRFAGPFRAPETTIDQKGPVDSWKLGGQRIFGSRFFLSGTFNYVGGGFEQIPNGGIDAEAVIGDDGIARGTGEAYLITHRPQEEWKLDGSVFFQSGSASHELRFGGDFRQGDNDSTFGATGRQVTNYSGEVWSGGLFPPDLEVAIVWRDQVVEQQIEQRAAWLQDTVTWDRLTVNAGFRYDFQDGTNQPSTGSGADLSDPRFLLRQDLAFEGADPGFEWEDVSPRVGVTYALGAERRTLLRASFGRFVDQLGADPLTHVNPLGMTFGVYYFTDLNGNLVFEPDQGEPFVFSFPYGFDPSDPGFVDTPNRVDPRLDAPLTDEVILGLEHAVLPDLVAGASITWRNRHEVLDFYPLVRDVTGAERLATVEDYSVVQVASGALPDGVPFAAPVYRLGGEVEPTGGQLLANGPREQRYRALTLDLSKRLSRGWMIHGVLTLTDWSWHIPRRRYGNPTDLEGSQDDDGSVVAQGLGNDVFANARWSVNVNGLYQVAPEKGWGFDLGWNVTGREGYPLPYYVAGAGQEVQATEEIDTFRLGDLWIVDGRINKDFHLGDLRLTVSLDGFNLANTATVLSRRRRLDVPGADFVTSVVNPRIFRLGVRVAFR